MARLATSARCQATLVACVVLLGAAPAAGQGGSDGSAFVDALQARAGALRLTDAQKQQLNILRIDAQIEAAPLAAERRVLGLKVRRQQLADPAQVAAADASAARLDQLDAAIARSERETARKALGVLTPKQRAQIAAEDLPSTAPAAAVAAAPAAPEGRDAKLVEFETSNAIAERLLKWAQWFAVVVGVPLAILAAVLAILGVKSFADFRGTVNKAREGVDADLKAEREKIAAELRKARETVDQQMADAAGLQTELAALRTRLGEVSELESNVRDIAAKVTRIEEFVGFEKSTALTPQLQATLEATLTRYRQWLREIGCEPGERVTVRIDDTGKKNAWYEPPNRMVIDEALAGDPDVLLREYTHHLLQERRTGAEPEFGSIQSGLADYLPSSFTGNPLFGVKSIPVFRKLYSVDQFPNDYLRKMDNRVHLKLNVGTVGPHAVGEAWSGAFWEMRTLLGASVSDPILLEAWSAAPTIADTAPGWRSFIRAVQAQVKATRPDAAGKVAAIFTRRWPTAKAPKRA